MNKKFDNLSLLSKSIISFIIFLLCIFSTILILRFIYNLIRYEGEGKELYEKLSYCEQLERDARADSFSKEYARYTPARAIDLLKIEIMKGNCIK